MADAFLTELSKQLAQIEQQLASVTSKMGKLQQGSVRFNPTAGEGGRWQGLTEQGRSSFLPGSQVEPINQVTADAVKKRLQDVRQYLDALGKQGHITSANMTEIVSVFANLGKAVPFGTTDWTQRFKDIITLTEKAIARIRELSEISRTAKTPPGGNPPGWGSVGTRVPPELTPPPPPDIPPKQPPISPTGNEPLKQELSLEEQIRLEIEGGNKQYQQRANLVQRVAGMQGRILQNLKSGGRYQDTNDDPTNYRKQMELAASITGGTQDVEFNKQLRTINAVHDAYLKLTPLQRAIVDGQNKLATSGALVTAQTTKQTRATKELSDVQVQSLRNNPNFQKAFGILDTQAQKMGFDPNKMKLFATTEATTGITHMTASLGELNGVSQKVSLTVDRMGNALVDTQRRFRGFGDAIARDVREFLQWSIAAGLIYGSFQKLNQLVSTMIQQETLLADITITLGKSQAETNKIFEAAVDIADKTGTSLTGVLEGYKLAYRATGNIANETERIATANKLMADSLTLSSLSGMQQAEALDTLTASLRQTGMSLDQGTVLLDKWVRTTQVANVSLQDLATGFAIVGEAADASGIKADQLNGIIATIAETGIASATEIGNVTRAIVSGYQSDNAKKAIESIGIALEDTSGKMRSFNDIVKQMNELRRSGGLSDEAFNRITLAWGGGSRRQAPVAAFIENYQRVGEVSTQSFSASGNAAQALQIKLDTVQKSVTRLANAFQSAAQTLGSENGLLDIINLVLHALTELVKVLGDVQKMSGSALVPALGTIATLFLATRGNTGLGALGSKIGLGTGAMLTRGLSRVGLGGGGYTASGTTDNGYLDPYASLRSGYNQPTMAQQIGGMLGPRLAAGAVGMLVNGIMPVLMDKGKDAGTKLAFTAGGTLVGMLGGPAGALIGSTIGSTIGQMYLSYLESKKSTIEGLFTLKVEPTPGETTPPITPEDAQKQAEKIGDAITKWFNERTGENKQLGLEHNAQGQILRPMETQYERYASRASEEDLKKIYEETFKGVDYEAAKKAKGGKNTDEVAKLLYVLQNYGDLLDESTRKMAEGYVADLQKLYSMTTKPDTAKTEEIFKTAVGEYQKQYGNLLDKVARDATDDITKQLESGDITVASGRNAIDALQTFKDKASQWGTIIRTKFSDLTDEEFNKMLANILTQTPSETQSDISTYTTNVQEAKNRLEELRKQIQESPEAGRSLQSVISDLQNQIKSNTEIAAQLTQQAYNTNLTNIPGMQRVDAGKLTTQQFPEFFDAMIKIFEERLMQEANANPNDKLTTDRVTALMTDTQQVIFDLSNGIAIKDMPASMVSIFNDLYSETVKQTGIMEQGMGYQLGGFTAAQYNAILPQYQAIRDTILAKGGESTETPQVILTDDGQWMVQQKDWKIIQYLLGQIADNTKKQLEGVYNMPEGASFWFPSSAIQYMQNAYADNGISAGTLPDLIAAGINRAQTYKEPVKTATTSGGYIDPGTGSAYGAYVRVPTPQMRPNGLSGENVIPPTNPATYPPNPTMPPSGAGTGGTGLDWFQEIINMLNSQAFTKPENTVTKLPTLNTKIELSSDVKLNIDGRTVAAVIIPWLGEFLNNFNGTTSSQTIKAII